MPNLAATWLSRLGLRPQVLDALPSQCAVCGRWPGPRICMDCRKRWIAEAHRCRSCAVLLPSLASHCGACLKQPPRLSQCCAVLDYGYPWQDLITRYKFEADLGLVRSLAGLMAEHPQTLQRLQCDALLPVPASDQRLRERGFDHTALLAKALAAQTAYAGAVLTGAVTRQHVSLPQHNAGRAQRLRQLRGVFALRQGQQAHIAERRILLLDDVMTTGATLDALAGCLLGAGAASVSAIVLARTP